MEQNYKNHSRFVTGYHKVLAVLLLAGFIGSVINLFESIGTDGLYSASLLTLLFICCFLAALYARIFALKAQDRAIRAEENFRHFILTGKQLPSDLKMSQIIALRFAPDEEYPDLALLTLKDNLKINDIKQSIKSWKADHNRV